jgi:hypothetical protein
MGWDVWGRGKDGFWGWIEGLEGKIREKREAMGLMAK